MSMPYALRGLRHNLSGGASLLVVEGGNDDISGPGQTEAVLGLCARLPGERKAYRLEPGVGHYGIFNGRLWRESIRPRIAGHVRAAARRERA